MPDTSTEARITSGLAAQRELLAARLQSGARQSGWKIGFGSPSGMELLGLDAPLMGHLLAESEIFAPDRVEPDHAEPARITLTGWTKPVIEAEIAAWIGADIPPGTPPEEVHQYLSGVGPAIEMADLDHAPADPHRILAGNIFQRAYLLGAPDSELSLEGISALSARFTHADEIVEVTDATALTGNLRQVLAHAANTAPALGRGLQAGDVILLGSIIAPRPVLVGETCRYSLGQFPELVITFE
jgi:2-keto-4-pentenoate hydratase